MTVKRSIEFHCDSCGNWVRYFINQVKVAEQHLLKTEGWKKVVRRNRGISHYCDECEGRNIHENIYSK